MQEIVHIDKLVHGGQALGTLPDGRKVLTWNALPGETVEVRLNKTKRSFTEGIAERIVKASPHRVEPRDEAYLSTSPWQIMEFAAENMYKTEILKETFAREKVTIPQEIPFYSDDQQWQYRNKMEYSFWADDDGLHLALFNRGSHNKRIVTGSSIARPEIDEVATKICVVLNQAGIRGSQLKSLVVRCDQTGTCVAALFVKDEQFPKIQELADICQGIAICFSNPKSPASILTRELYVYGTTALTDRIMDHVITYTVHSFFQVNLPVFSQALGRIQEGIADRSPVVDFYSGVGTIGIPIGATKLVENDTQNVAMAKRNATTQEVILAPAESALDHVPTSGVLVVDPPRAGMHNRLIEQILESKPEYIVYLSCNPITQARDIALLQPAYTMTSLEGFNFFPRTPHIESLALLTRQS